MREALADIGQRATSVVPASRRALRRGLMQGCQESRQGIGCLGTASRGGAVSRLTSNPGSDNPSAREPLGRLAQTLRNRYRQWEARRHSRQQGVLLEEQFVCGLSGPGQPDRKVVAEPPQLIVPATSTKRQRQVGQVGVLFAEQLCNQIRGDLIFSVRHRRNRSPSIENRPLVSPIGTKVPSWTGSLGACGHRRCSRHARGPEILPDPSGKQGGGHVRRRAGQAGQDAGPVPGACVEHFEQRSPRAGPGTHLGLSSLPAIADSL